MRMNEISRRELGKIFAVAAVGRVIPSVAMTADEWTNVRAQFSLDQHYIVMNAANLCPASRPVNEVLFKLTNDMDSNPSFQNRDKFGKGREETRGKIAAYLNVAPGEVVLTRNTSEGNNFVSSGIELKAGDEIVLHDENHPTNLDAWKEKQKRFGFKVVPVHISTPPPSAESIIKAMTAAITPKTRVLSFTHVTSTFGTRFPAKELCQIARERGIITLLDGAQSFGALDLDLKDIGCDFFTGSSHKWMMGPKEVGVLYIRSDIQSKLWPSEVGVIGGQVGASKVFERLGQRDDPAIVALGEAIDFQMKIGKKNIERQAIALGTALKEGLKKITGIQMYSPSAPEISSAIVTFRPGSADLQKIYSWLYETRGIACTTRGGDAPGLRFSPHVYNSFEQVEKVVGAFQEYLKKS
jgi:isopenicillin-N epimerase